MHGRPPRSRADDHLQSAITTILCRRLVTRDGLVSHVPARLSAPETRVAAPVGALTAGAGCIRPDEEITICPASHRGASPTRRDRCCLGCLIGGSLPSWPHPGGFSLALCCCKGTPVFGTSAPACRSQDALTRAGGAMMRFERRPATAQPVMSACGRKVVAPGLGCQKADRFDKEESAQHARQLVI